MISIFRKIRQKLIASGSVTKYLLYAVGEILLVVIGILIALQVNNWNEERKDQEYEKEILIGLYESVTNNREILLNGLENWNSTSQAIEIITYAIDNDLPFADSLKYHFREAHRPRGNNLNRLNYSGYKSLENKGYEILRNKALRSSVVALFESELPGLESTSEQIDFSRSGFHAEYIVRNFISDNQGEYPINYDRVMNDPFYYSILKRLANNLHIKKIRVSNSQSAIDETIRMLENELKILKDD